MKYMKGKKTKMINEEIKNKISEYVDAHMDELLTDIKTLIGTDSSRAEAKPGMPYGEGPAKVLAQGMEIFEKYGFAAKNYDNYVITADMNGLTKAVDVLAHLDVVPAGEGWTVTGAFEPKIVGGRLYGRGSIDDKGPAMAALLAMRAVRDLELPVKSGARLILGSDEECGSSDIAYYFKKEPYAPMTFSPDANFPLINIEKGGLAGRFGGNYEVSETLPRVTTLHGGKTTNVVPNKAYAEVEGLTDNMKAAAEKRAAELGVEIAFDEGGIIRIDGVSAHASLPEKGNNAVTALMDIVTKIANDSAAKLIGKLLEIFPHGDTCGEAAGVKMSDELSGALTMTLDILDVEDGYLHGVFDCRAPICATEDNLYRVMKERLGAVGLVFDDGVKMNPPHHADGNSSFVKTLLSCYEAYTGIKGEPLAIGGGTYVHSIENGVAFGCEIEGIDNHMHGADEFIDIDVLAQSAKIFALSIYELCK